MAVMGQLQQRWGSTVIRQGPRPRQSTFPHISTDFQALDTALGIGGLPRGRITVLSGAPTSGKLTLAAIALAAGQAETRLPAGYIDALGTCDGDYLQACRVKLGDLLVMRPTDARQALDMLVSLAAVPLAAIIFDAWDTAIADAHTQRYADAILARLAPQLDTSLSALLVLVDDGSALSRRHAALAGCTSLHLHFTRMRWRLQGPDVRGYTTRVEIVKNKLAPAGPALALDIDFDSTLLNAGL